MGDNFIGLPIYENKTQKHIVKNNIEYKICLGVLCRKGEKGVWKTLDSFTKSKKSYDGLFYKCKECKNSNLKVQKESIPKGCHKCSHCKNVLKLNSDNFHRNKSSKTGYMGICKECRLRKVLGNKPRKDVIIYNNGKKGRNCIYCKKWRSEDECYKRPNGDLRGICIECKSKRSKEYMEEVKNDEEKYKQYLTNKVNWAKTNIHCKISTNLRTRMRSLVVNKNPKDSTSFKLVGCSIDNLKSHLENQFNEGMTWDNYGSYWHIDHIIPCAAFNLKNKQEQKRCFNYHNLQPLKASENIAKTNKYTFNPTLELKLYFKC